jgi:hypothetical protein
MKQSKQLSTEIVNTETGEITKPRFKSHYNTNQFPTQGERNILPSLAVPDMALTVQEIIKRHTRGIPIFMHNNGTYQDGPDPLNGRDINTLDIEEIQQIATQARERYTAAQDKWTAEQEQMRQERVKEHWQQEYHKTQSKLNKADEVQRAEPTRSAQSPSKD